jgi:hypothetical protein
VWVARLPRVHFSGGFSMYFYYTKY